MVNRFNNGENQDIIGSGLRWRRRRDKDLNHQNKEAGRYPYNRSVHGDGRDDEEGSEWIPIPTLEVDEFAWG